MLPPVPTEFSRSRDGLHALGFYVLSSARRARTGRIGLQWTPGGFGTPRFDGTQLRIERSDLVVESDTRLRRAPITTLAAAGELAGHSPNPEDKNGFDVLDMPPPDEPLGVALDAVALLDAWFALGTTVLDELRAREADREPTTPTLWPEHFDLAIALGSEAGGERATYGLSPGDAAHAEPYAYVSAWTDVDRSDPYWNDRSFSGASLPYAEVVAVVDPHARVLDFFRRGLGVLSDLPLR